MDKATKRLVVCTGKTRLMNFAQISAVISDMDGVLWQGEAPLPGLSEFFESLRQLQMPFILATNNSSKTQADYVAKLAKLGIKDIREAQIVTSGTATASYLRAHYTLDTPVHVIGSDSLRHVVRQVGFRLTEGDEARVVVAGLDWQLTYEKLKRASMLIRGGADFVGTNPDVTYPSPEGPVPGTGALLAALQAASGKAPVIVGKPHPPMYEAALALLGTPPGQTLMIGDRLDTDISGAAALGLPTALVLTGISSRADINGSVRPDVVYEGLPALIEALRQR